MVAAIAWLRHGSNFDLLLRANALALDPDGLGVMQEPIEKGGLQDRIVVDDARAPLDQADLREVVC